MVVASAMASGVWWDSLLISEIAEVSLLGRAAVSCRGYYIDGCR